MNNLIGLLFTFLIGLFILIGAIVVFVSKNNNKFLDFSISIALGVIVSLVFLELIPESFELIYNKYSFLITFVIIIGFTLLGIIILKIVDEYVPHGHGDGHDHGEDLYHLGVVSSIGIVIHNIIEGMAIFSSVTSSVSLGVLMSIGVGLHNVPMGMVIASALLKSNISRFKTIMIIMIIALSTFVGGLIMFLNSALLSNELILGISLSITQGMLAYIAVFELLPHIMASKNKKSNILGITTGILLIVVSLIFH